MALDSEGHVDFDSPKYSFCPRAGGYDDSVGCDARSIKEGDTARAIFRHIDGADIGHGENSGASGRPNRQSES